MLKAQLALSLNFLLSVACSFQFLIASSSSNSLFQVLTYILLSLVIYIIYIIYICLFSMVSAFYALRLRFAQVASFPAMLEFISSFFRLLYVLIFQLQIRLVHSMYIFLICVTYFTSFLQNYIYIIFYLIFDTFCVFRRIAFSVQIL